MNVYVYSLPVHALNKPYTIMLKVLFFLTTCNILSYRQVGFAYLYTWVDSEKERERKIMNDLPTICVDSILCSNIFSN